MCLIPFQCLLIGVELYLTNKLTEKAIFGRVQLARYISIPITLRYDTLRPSNSSPFSQGRNWSFFMSSEWITIGKLKGCVLSI